MTGPLHLVVGPAEHGVVRHGVDVATACGDQLLRADEPTTAVDLLHDSDIRGRVVQIPFTDRVFAATCEQAARRFGELADTIAAAGATISVTLHDVPRGDDPLSDRRRRAYREVISRARGVVVNSSVELATAQDWCVTVHSLRLIPLPVEPMSPDRPVDGVGGSAAGEPEVTVLGFVYPDRGYEQVLDELPAGCALVALGRPSDGHADLAERLATDAASRGVRWQLTGFVPDAELAARLATAAVPVAPNTRVAASGSIGTWLTHGRRPLVPDTEYTRELAARMPGALAIYDASRPGALRAAIASALEDPASTWLPLGTRLVPDLRSVADQYREHLASCGPPEALHHGERLLLPENRFDLVPARTDVEPVSVIVPFYSGDTGAAQIDLDRVLAALALQTLRPRIEIVVADDGSPVAPDVTAAGDLPVRVVRQEHRGFGAGRARNLGAHHARYDVLAFLDGDTVPEPDYLERLTRLPAAHPDALVVGRRRHADLDGWSTERVTQWLTGAQPAPPELTEPQWLRSAYVESRNLLDADRRSYRFVISAVLAVHREMFERIGGFDERFDHYGGEDWELANRAWRAGALFAHEPAAVAWHCGPDWADRPGSERRSAKDVETRALASLLPDPDARGGGQWFPYPYAVVTMDADDETGVLATARSVFAAAADALLWLTGPTAARTVGNLADPRIRVGPPPDDVLRRAGVVVDVHHPCDLSTVEVLGEIAEQHGIVVTPAVTVRASRAVSRCSDPTSDDDNRDRSIARLFGHHDRSTPAPAGDRPLHQSLQRLAPHRVSRS